MLIVNTGSLADCLKQQDGSGDADIQGVESAQHRDTDVSRGGMAPLVGQSCSLRPHDDGCALPHVLAVIETGVLQLGGQYLDITLLQETDTLLRAAGNSRDGEDGTDAAAYQIGIIKVGQRVTHDDGISLGGISGAKDGTRLPGFSTLSNTISNGFAGNCRSFSALGCVRTIATMPSVVPR